jgi:RES domain-containing protein
LRFTGTCYRAHDPRWAFKPISGAGAAVHGGRFNPRGSEALYLALSSIGAVNEAAQGFAFKLQPMVLCSYDVDIDGIADLRTAAGRTEHGVSADDMACAWFSLASAGQEPPSWDLFRRLSADGVAGLLVPSYAPGATGQDHNLVLWRWGEAQVRVYDPSGRLPKDQLSWA